ncbi:hypothetical protein RDWZM_001583 [Blomia tropicalis]|uniref:Uncharacterized protein n=1 Tax=Blomia tropicalis TaxID=40697 RepID=A0A9Q0MAX0_BLOTA|nr:hypothetical protein RDWZM_001583 [Blomia tropicalis]
MGSTVIYLDRSRPTGELYDVLQIVGYFWVAAITISIGHSHTQRMNEPLAIIVSRASDHWPVGSMSISGVYEWSTHTIQDLCADALVAAKFDGTKLFNWVRHILVYIYIGTRPID